MARTQLQLIDGQELQAFSSSNTFISRLLSDSSGNLSITPGSGLSIINKDGIGATQGAYGLEVINNTAATLGNQQYSPNTIWQGNGWSTTNSASRTVAFRVYNKPVQGAANPTGKWTLEVSINGGAWTEVLNCDSIGGLTAAGVVAGASANFGSGGVTGGFISMSSTSNSVGDLTVTNLTASKPVFTDGSKLLTSSGTVGVGNGGTGSTSFSSGSVIFSNGTILTENTKLSWDNTNATLNIDDNAATLGLSVSKNSVGTSINLYRSGGGLSPEISCSGSQLFITTATASQSILFRTGGARDATTTNCDFVIDGAGNCVIGRQSALSTSATDGFLYIPTCAGAPSGTPTLATGKKALVYDTTNNKFYIYNGAWKSVTLA